MNHLDDRLEALAAAIPELRPRDDNDATLILHGVPSKWIWTSPSGVVKSLGVGNVAAYDLWFSSLVRWLWRRRGVHLHFREDDGVFLLATSATLNETRWWSNYATPAKSELAALVSAVEDTIREEKNAL